MPKLPHPRDCGCFGCFLIRAGLCADCAHRFITFMDPSAGGSMMFELELCSGSCREALERVVAWLEHEDADAE